MKLISRIYTSLTTNNKALFAFFWMCTLVICLPAYKAGFNADFEGLMDYYSKHNFSEFINSKGFNVKSLYQVTHFQLYFLIRFFGHNPIPWYFLITLLHSVNGFLTFQLFKKVMRDFSIQRAEEIAFWGGLLFLISPNITEITIWKGGYHYLPGVAFQLIILLQLRQSLLYKKWGPIIAINAIYLVSIFTLEIFYLTPWYVLILLLAYKWKGLIDNNYFKRNIISVFGSMLLIFVFHLLLFKLKFGTWIAHYGTVGEFYFSIDELFPKLLKYISTLLLLTPHLPHHIADSIFRFTNLPGVYYTTYIIITLLSVILIVRFKKNKPSVQVATILLGMFMLGIGINSTIFFDELFQMYNSRRCYFIAPFFYIALSLLLFHLIQRSSIRITALVCTALGYSLLCIKKAFHWRHATKIQYAMLTKYKWQKENTVIILNMPTYYNDVRVLHTSNHVLLNESLKVMQQDTATGQVYTAAAYNMNLPWDGAHVVMLDSMTVKVTLNQWGSWWFYDYLGATNYENDLFRFELGNTLDYTLYLKRKPNNLILLYQQGDEWRTVDLNKGKDEEQW